MSANACSRQPVRGSTEVYDLHMGPRFSIFIATSLDGYIARADGGIDWLSIVHPVDEAHGYGTFMSSVDTIVIGRGTYDRFMVNTDVNQSGFQYIAKGQPAIDMEVDTHYYNPLASTGWHKHPGPVYITVTSGQLTFYEFDDPTCSPHVYNKGQGFVDFGSGHIGINQDPINSASDVTVAITSVGGVFRAELPAGNPNCSF